MAHRPRAEMIAETRAKLIAAGRGAFGAVGYQAASMDDFTAEAGLTRGALHHHFGDKRGLFAAVVMQIDAEMSERLARVSAAADTAWKGFVDESVAYIEMALEPEIQRIVMLDGPAVLGDPSSWPNQNACIAGLSAHIERLKAEGTVRDLDSEATARLVSGASLSAALWIANAEDPEATARRAVAAFRKLLDGLLRAGNRTAA